MLNRVNRRYKLVRTPSSYLDEILAFGLSDEGLELRSGESVDESSLGDDEEEDLSASEDGQFVGHGWASALTSMVAIDHTFFMIPALRFEKVM